MTRIFAALLTASGLLSSIPSALAADWPTFELPNGVVLAPSQDTARWSSHYWPQVAHAPAITKTLTANPHHPVPTTPPPSYDYRWQNQPSPPAPVLAPPKFSHPQQGYYPREQLAPQIAPGYEYDFGGAGSYPPLYPIEGANWKAPRTDSRAPHLADFRTTALDADGYAHCPL